MTKKENEEPFSRDIIFLYNYWINCNAIWHSEGVKPLDEFSETKPTNNSTLFNFIKEEEKEKQLLIAYSLLYVVVEGYQSLELRNTQIDHLLEEKSYLNKMRGHLTKERYCAIL